MTPIITPMKILSLGCLFLFVRLPFPQKDFPKFILVSVAVWHQVRKYGGTEDFTNRILLPIPGKVATCSERKRPSVPRITVQAFRGKPSRLIGAQRRWCFSFFRLPVLCQASSSSPRTATWLSSVNSVTHLDTASHLIKHHKRSGNVFISLTGARGYPFTAQHQTV